MRSVKQFSLSLIAIFSVGLMVTSISNANDKPAKGSSASSLVKVTLQGSDQMKFDKAEIKVPKGSKVELTLTHSGKLPVKVMGHNFVLLKPGVDIAKFSMAAMQSKDNDYIPKGSKDVIAHTGLVGGGASTTITFEAPAPGTYSFICSFPGHYAMMKGKFIVE